MPRDPRYDILFEPVEIGTVTTKKRFNQVPHCNGMGYRDVSAMARMRGVKAEGGWGVVCTEQVEFHHTSDITPFIELRLWDERDIPALARMAEAVHEHDVLAGIELAYNGMNGPNFYSREVPMGPSHLPVASFTYDPVQARAMDKEDIRNLRRWHKQAALRGKAAGFDIVYVYAAHGLSGLEYFLSRRYNTRTDEYGGSLENRIRLIREIIEDTKEAVGDTCVVAVRFTVDELLGEAGLHKEEAHEMIGLMAEVPDLWDLVLAGWENDSQTSRYGEQGLQEPFVAGVKQLTSKPVVGVGWFTSPDAMVSQVKRGILDFIGAARPSIADPFLPKKVEEGRMDEIRECIGCNICVSGDMTMSPIRCTQNPTKGEEWRKGWHPEEIEAKGSDDNVLVVGAGPAGMECARALGQRGYDVVLAEAGTERGGRVVREASLPGLSAWIRVKDYRELQLQEMVNVETYFDSRLTTDDIMAFGFAHVAIATGATWRRDGVARTLLQPIPTEDGAEVLTPDDLMDGNLPSGSRVIVYDDDHYYMGGVLAELLVQEGCEVTLVTPAADVSNWTHNTLEQGFIQKKLLELRVQIRAHHTLSAVKAGAVEASCVFTGRTTELPADSVVTVTARLPNDQLYLDLKGRQDEWAEAGIKSVKVIGDACAPGPIAYAIYAGHRYARELDAPDIGDAVPFERELTELAAL